MSEQQPPKGSPPLQLASPDELRGLEPEQLARQAVYLQSLLLDVDCGLWEWHPHSGRQRAQGPVWSIFSKTLDSALCGLWTSEDLPLVHSDDREKLLALRQRLAGQGGCIDAAFRAYDGAGQLYWLRLWGRAFKSDTGELFAIGGCADYSEALSEPYLSNLPGEWPLQALAGIGDGLWEWDLRAEEIVLDRACWAMLGYERGQVDANARTALSLWKSRVLPEDLPRLEQAFTDHLAEQLPLDVEFRLWHRDGGIVWMRCRGQVQRNSRGEPLRVLGVMQDITASREALARAERELTQLQRENKNRANLLFGLSHELRTPLNAILGYSQMIELDQSLNPDQRQRLGEIRRAGQHLLHLVGDVLELARIDSFRLAPSMEPIQPASLMAECKRLLEPLAETRRVSLIFEPLGWESAYISADPVRFKQVVLNLAGNAVKYNRENGRVVINFAPQAEGWLRLSILDTGRGIPEDRRAEVFEPFNRLGAEKGHIEGTGVGLAIAKRLTEAMGGRIDFDSHEGQGSIFWIEFPLIDPPAEVMQLTAGPSDPVELPSCHILHVDSRPSSVARLKAMLAGFPQVRLLVAADAVEAIFTARTQCPDIMLFDASVPGISAADTARILKADPVTASIRFVVVGEYSGESCDAGLPDSYDLAQLSRVLSKCLADAMKTAP
ncbi:ATP-binding protein [Microbulbifer thermotolerans]|uniref:ATP-binding protein n=1 Tax=Microbulbifer thermotolerans TaxID=252514 RepID=UPI00224AE905|nr:ATP-binding protein [Microbulbifer thermotolerans]MCX2779071.1 ATP-binding protein [Microbulbifer thermotolerans]MCX2804632.1 ATP-binding protein [Microbulbifer thermotolerans]